MTFTHRVSIICLEPRQTSSYNGVVQTTEDGATGLSVCFLIAAFCVCITTSAVAVFDWCVLSVSRKRRHTYLKYNTQPDMSLDDQKDFIFVTLKPKGFEWDQLEGTKRQGSFHYIRSNLYFKWKMTLTFGTLQLVSFKPFVIMVTKITSFWSSNDMSGWVLYFRHVTHICLNFGPQCMRVTP